MKTIDQEIIERAERIIDAYRAIRVGSKRNTTEFLAENQNAATWCKAALAEGQLPSEITDRKDFYLALAFFA